MRRSMPRPTSRKGTPRPMEYIKSRNTTRGVDPWLKANVETAPSTGPMHGVQPTANAIPRGSAPTEPCRTSREAEHESEHERKPQDEQENGHDRPAGPMCGRTVARHERQVSGHQRKHAGRGEGDHTRGEGEGRPPPLGHPGANVGDHRPNPRSCTRKARLAPTWKSGPTWVADRVPLWP